MVGVNDALKAGVVSRDTSDRSGRGGGAPPPPPKNPPHPPPPPPAGPGAGGGGEDLCWSTVRVHLTRAEARAEYRCAGKGRERPYSCGPTAAFSKRALS